MAMIFSSAWRLSLSLIILPLLPIRLFLLLMFPLLFFVLHLTPLLLQNYSFSSPSFAPHLSAHASLLPLHMLSLLYLPHLLAPHPLPPPLLLFLHSYSKVFTLGKTSDQYIQHLARTNDLTALVTHLPGRPANWAQLSRAAGTSRELITLSPLN